MANSTHARLDSIQLLRAIAALVVVWDHAVLELQHFHVLEQSTFTLVSSMGRAGVDIFFVISGFVMVYVSWEHFQERGESGRFILRRIFRVVPVYWFYTSLMLLVVVLSPSLIRGGEHSLAFILGSYFFIPVENPGGDGFHPLLGLGWTLNYEMFFYVLFTPFLFLRRFRAVLGLAVCFILLTFAGRFLESADGAVWVWTRPIILEFAAGCVLAALYLSGWRMRRMWGLLLVATALCWLVYAGLFWNRGGPDIRVVVTGIPATVIVAGFLFGLPLASGSGALVRGLVMLGDASYSLYLVHMFVIRAVTKFLSHIGLGDTLHAVLFLMAVLLLCITVAMVSYRLIERPSNRFLRNWSRV